MPLHASQPLICSYFPPLFDFLANDCEFRITIFVIRFLNMIWSISRLVYTTFLEKGLYKLVDAGSCQAIAPGNYGPFLSKFFETRHIYEVSYLLLLICL